MSNAPIRLGTRRSPMALAQPRHVADMLKARTGRDVDMVVALQAGCSAPVGAYAAGTDALRLDAVVVSADGGEALRVSVTGPAAQAGRLGRQVAADLLNRGAGRFMDVSAGHLSNGEDVT